ncbi:hypothetical protein EDD36DRAFT_271205 [Exophiala viscosa]|uniref:Uncharacterized protein n=1 Tax=Exophiala viscosa TaxID=2486360 RepID=A0AAN6ICG8_9EURO|nr:hypothetical protein EDD36DRAFT_271205 [Exophiala viscosa]
MVVPHTASRTAPTSLKQKLNSPWSRQKHQHQTPVTDILRSLARSNPVIHTSGAKVTGTHEQCDSEMPSEPTTSGKSSPTNLLHASTDLREATHNDSDWQLVPPPVASLQLTSALTANNGQELCAPFPSPIIGMVVEDAENTCTSLVLASNMHRSITQLAQCPQRSTETIDVINPVSPNLTSNALSLFFGSGVTVDHHREQALNNLVYPSQETTEDTQQDRLGASVSGWVVVPYLSPQFDEVVEVDVPQAGFIEPEEVDDNDSPDSSYIHSRPRSNSLRIHSDSTAATSADIFTSAAEHEELQPSLVYVHAHVQPAEHEADNCNEEDESEQFREELEHQQSLNQGLRSQLLEREDDVARLQEELSNIPEERDRYEAQQDNADAEVRKLRQELANKDKQLAAEKARSASAIQQMQAFRNSHGLTNQQLISQRDEAHLAAQRYFIEARRLQGIVDAISVARETLEQDGRNSEQREALLQQHIADFSEEVSARFEQANDTISGLEQQNNHLLQQKERAEAQVKAVNRAITLEYIKDPSPPFNPRTIKPNEVRDLTQALELTQKHCADLKEQMNDMLQDSVKKDAEIAQLRTDVDLAKNRAARLSATFEIWRNHIANWIETVPVISQMKGDVEAVPGLKEQLDEVALHEHLVGKALKDSAEEVSNLELKLAKVERRHSRELEKVHKRSAELQESNIRLDGENFKLNTRFEGIDVLQRQLEEKTTEAKEWRKQAEHQTYGDTATIIRNEHLEEVENWSNQVKALNDRIWEWSQAYDNVASDLNLLQWQTARTMGDVRELDAERDWYKAYVIALKDRFEVELLANPLNIPWKSDFSLLNMKSHIELVAREDMIINELTGFDLGRSEELVQAAAKDAKKAAEEGPRGIAATDIWAEFVAEFAERQKAKAAQQVNGGGNERIVDSKGNSIMF